MLQRIVLFALMVLPQASGRDLFRKCKEGKSVGPLPPTAKNTSQILEDLRKGLASANLQAYIIPASDDHQQEYIAPQFQRRQFVTGFTGSAGTAVVTSTKAALWTDGRYYDQAEMQLDCNWILMKEGVTGTPSITSWLLSELKAGEIVGIDSRLISISLWKSYQSTFKSSGKGVNFIAQKDNLIDKIWSSKPKPKAEKVSVLAFKYAGETWQDKVKRLRTKMKANNCDLMVLSALDENAWILNLRGKDIPYNPFFISYILLSPTEISLFIDQDKLTDKAKEHLCPNKADTANCVKIEKYEDMKKQLDTKLLSASKFWLDPKASHYLELGVNEKKILLEYSPVQLMKSTKNPVEVAGMKLSNLKDSVAIAEFFTWLEKEINNYPDKVIDEISAAEQLRLFKSRQKNYVSLSFGTISAFGPNAATIHYRATNQTNRRITKDGTYLLDSGCQFLDGSTDITRTIYLGTPSDFIKEAYTHVLKGAINLASIVFPQGIYGKALDVLARKSLWHEGLGYRHGTGHGIGHYLSIHEGPQSIGYGKIRPYEKALLPGMVTSDEPGYYETGKFGIRLESAILVVNATTRFRFGDRNYYTFETITLLPFSRNLIKKEILTLDQIKWLNDYNAKTRKVLGDELKRQNKMEVFKWMMRETEPISYSVYDNAGFSISASNFLGLITLSIVAIIYQL